MDFSSTGIQSILNESLQHKNVKLIMTVSKAEELINMIESTFGKDPYKKILLDNYDNLVITSDTTKILQSIKLVHPFQFLLRDVLNKMNKLGDGNTFLILLIGKFLNRCKDLLAQGMSAYQLVESLKDIKKRVLTQMDALETGLERTESSSMCNLNMSFDDSKRNNQESFENKRSDFDEDALRKALCTILKDEKLVDLLTDAIVRSGFINPDDIRIQKIQTGSLEDSFVINGMLIENSVETEILEKKGRCAIYNTSLDIERSETKGTLMFEKAEDLLNYSKDEDKSIEAVCDSISENCDIVFFNGNVNERFVEFFNLKNVLTVKVISKFDLRRLMRMTNSKLLQNIKKPLLEDTGLIDSIKTVYFGDKKYLKMEKNGSNLVTIVLKDSLSSSLNENELLLEKGIKVLENLNNKNFCFVKGSGHFEKELAQFLEKEAESITSGKKMVFNDIAKALREFECKNVEKEVFDILLTKRHAFESACDIACEVLMIEDYLVAKADVPMQE
ncbi:Chaperonin complex component, TCP-1 theta subunit (CCT8) [Pseudoloma neurophilia]|uniref:Chaperonin complex component, TCP-1 theta subunit (CCT8) n=1 Tax=Pseudoloma neurophilia TaxID=146866 RepID=A0A0R0M170_9MICR|nr:Chaperonin complex component, TCP-1 theta subunit (CCT8) [Pseudoloma neurophilia]